MLSSLNEKDFHQERLKYNLNIELLSINIWNSPHPHPPPQSGWLSSFYSTWCIHSGSEMLVNLYPALKFFKDEVVLHFQYTLHASRRKQFFLHFSSGLQTSKYEHIDSLFSSSSYIYASIVLSWGFKIMHINMK